MHFDEPDLDGVSLAAMMAALSDPVRVAIVRELDVRGEASCGACEVGVSKATRSHHFKVLREAGVLSQRQVGTARMNTLRRDDLDARFPGLLDTVLRSVD